MKFYIILLGILVMLSSITYGDRIMNFGEGTGAGSMFFTYSNYLKYSSVNFTSNASFDLDTLEFYVSEVNIPTTDKFVVGIYSVNSSGGFGSQVGGNSTEHNGLASTGYDNVTWSSNYPSLTNGGKYWIAFMNTETQVGSKYFRIGSGGSSTGNYYWGAGNSLFEIWGAEGNQLEINIKLWGTITSGSSIIEQVNYTTPVISGELNTILLNITNSSIPPESNTLQQANATLYYNNNVYNMTQLFQNGTSAGFYYSVNAPSTLTDLGFNITYYANGNYYNTGNLTQEIRITSINVTALACTPLIFNFTLYDEENFTYLNGTWNYNFKYGLSNNTFFTTNGSITGYGFNVCFDNSSTHNLKIGYGEIDYYTSGWVSRRYYIFQNTSVNDTSTLPISIYDLNTASATAFSLQVQSASGELYKNKYVSLIRYYNGLNAYKVVDMGLTDDTGSSVIYVKTQDVDYRIAVYELNGSLIYIANPIRMVCLTTPCSYTLRVIPEGVDYTSLLKIQYTFTFNSTTGMWTYVYSDPSLLSSGMNLSIYQQTNYGDTLICNSVISGYVGAVNCNTSGYVGNFIGKVTRLPGNYNIAQLLSDITSTPFKSEFGLWLTLVIAIPIILLFAMVSPIALLVGAVISLIPALYFGSLNWLIVGGIAILAFIVSHFIKRVS